MNCKTHTICDACETVAHCTRNGCVPLVPLSEAPKLLRVLVPVVQAPKHKREEVAA